VHEDVMQMDFVDAYVNNTRKVAISFNILFICLLGVTCLQLCSQLCNISV
jgi:hypothetical protein